MMFEGSCDTKDRVMAVQDHRNKLHFKIYTEIKIENSYLKL